MKEDNTPTVTARRRVPSAKQRLRLENAKRLKVQNQHFKTVRQKKKEAKHNAAQTDPENHISITRLPRVKKNNLSEPPKATSKFKKRQRHKTWLPTHLWHAKRAHMTKPSEPLWRMAIPISPTEKSYRPSHRASGGRGCVAWDMSYMSTVSCQGVEASIEGLLRAVGFHAEGWAGAKYKRWKKGTRSADGWVFERDNKQAIAPVMVVWCAETPDIDGRKRVSRTGDVPEQNMSAIAANVPSENGGEKKYRPPNRQLFIRVHPSAFQQLWLILIKVAKTQRPQVMMEDLRFEIGSIEITGPGSTEALLGVLKPVESLSSSETSPHSVWTSLAGLTNPASLPQGALLHFNISDPRLNHPPKQISIPSAADSVNALTELTVAWPPDSASTLPDLFSHKSRHIASTSLPSQKAINRRKTLAPPGQPPIAKESDPRIPVLLLATRPPSNASGSQGAWTVLLPWKCVDPIWRSLIYYPLSSGGTPRFGGLDERRQICFEPGETWFPGDAAATEAGQAWERTESAKRFHNWTRRPPSRRIKWETVELGNGKKGEHGRGWACDWHFLLTGRAEEPIDGPESNKHGNEPTDVTVENAREADSPPKTQKQRKLAKARESEKAAADEEHAAISTTNSAPQEPSDAEGVVDYSASEAIDTTVPQKPTPAVQTTASFVHFHPSLATPLFRNFQNIRLPSEPSLVTIRIMFLTRGTPTPCARIYRLQSAIKPIEAALRKQWLSLDPTASTSAPKHVDTRNGNQSAKIKKDKLNHRGDLKGHRVHPFESLDYMNYVPPDAPPEFFKTPEYLKAAEAQAAALAAAGGSTCVNDEPTAESRAALIQSLMTSLENTIEHPPCPDVGDLIGFVTSGSFNLAEGRGTAIGSIWVQKLIEGWRVDRPDGVNAGDKRMERQRRLCVVRNAGEGVGRLGLWELCQ